MHAGVCLSVHVTESFRRIKQIVFRKETKASPQPFMTGHGTGKMQEAELMLSPLSPKATMCWRKLQEE